MLESWWYRALVPTLIPPSADVTWVVWAVVGLVAMGWTIPPSSLLQLQPWFLWLVAVITSALMDGLFVGGVTSAAVANIIWLVIWCCVLAPLRIVKAMTDRRRRGRFLGFRVWPYDDAFHDYYRLRDADQPTPAGRETERRLLRRYPVDNCLHGIQVRLLRIEDFSDGAWYDLNCQRFRTANRYSRVRRIGGVYVKLLTELGNQEHVKIFSNRADPNQAPRLADSAELAQQLDQTLTETPEYLLSSESFESDPAKRRLSLHWLVVCRLHCERLKSLGLVEIPDARFVFLRRSL